MHNLARPTSRPLRLLSDMQAMMEETQAFENRVLERLNAGKTVRSFLIATVELLTEAVNILVLQVFRKDDYAVKYAVEPLLEGSGPLGDLSVRLKLIYGLGVISRAEYEDADAADGIDAGDGVHLLILTDDVNLIAMTGIQGIKYGLIDIGKRQFDARVGQQFTDKATSDITCAKM